jgi:hypothetical protein
MRGTFNRNADRQFRRDLPGQVTAIRVELDYLAGRLAAEPSKDLRAAAAAVIAAVRAIDVARNLIDKDHAGKEGQ